MFFFLNQLFIETRKLFILSLSLNTHHCLDTNTSDACTLSPLGMLLGRWWAWGFLRGQTHIVPGAERGPQHSSVCEI